MEGVLIKHFVCVNCFSLRIINYYKYLNSKFSGHDTEIMDLNKFMFLYTVHDFEQF